MLEREIFLVNIDTYYVLINLRSLMMLSQDHGESDDGKAIWNHFYLVLKFTLEDNKTKVDKSLKMFLFMEKY